MFCRSECLELFTLGDSHYLYCRSCGGIMLGEAHRLPPEAERARYDKHRNSLSDPGYKAYLEKFLDSAFLSLRAAGLLFQERDRSGSALTVLDYGSGPYPALVEIMQSRGLNARGYDPFFAPDALRFPGGADIVTCLEVAEHFYLPEQEFFRIASWMHPGSVLILQTHFLPDCPDSGVQQRFFKDWWYRHDSTHVSFYTLESLKAASRNAGFSLISADSGGLAVLLLGT